MTDTITKEQAIEIAQSKNTMQISPDSTLVVDQDDLNWIIEWKRNLPQNVHGPDYDAKIWVNKQDGTISKYLVGS